MCYPLIEAMDSQKTPVSDKVVREAPPLGDELCPPGMDFIAHLQRERDAWLVGSAAAGTHPAPVLAKAAGYANMSSYRTALHRARRRMEIADA